MRIYVQHGVSSLSLEVSIAVSIGDLYERVLTRLGVDSHQVVSMIHGHHVLGHEPLTFYRSLISSDIHPNSIIFVTYNHYPELLQLYGESTHARFQAWLPLRQSPFNDQRMRFDPVAPSSYTPHLPQLLPPAIISRPPLPTPHVPLVPSRVLPTPLILPESLVPPRPNPPAPQVNLDSDGDISPLPILDLADRLLMDRLLNGQLLLHDVVITLTSYDFQRLERRPYRDLIVSYQQRFPNEQPYDHCPVEQSHQFTPEQLVVVLGCGHYFSEQGIRPWLTERSTKCPLCDTDTRPI